MKQSKILYGLKVGFYAGAILSVMLSCLALAMYAIPGESDADRLGVGIAWTILSYALTGILGGPVLGLVWGLTGGRIPGALLAFAAGVILGGLLALGAAMRGVESPRNVFFGSVLAALVLGAPVGYAVERDAKPRSHRKKQ